MKTTIYLMSALAGAALLTACSADTTDPDFDGQGSEVLVRATIGSATTRTSPEASNNMVFSNGDKMSLYDGKNTGVYTYDSGTDKWSPAAGEFLKWEKSGTIEAWSPANGTNQYDKGVIMQDQSTSDNLAACDYMTGSYTYSSIPADRTLTLMMERETALVVIDKDFEYGDEFDGTTATVTDVCVMSSLYVPNDDDLKAISPYTDADGYRYAIVSPTQSNPFETFIQLTVTAGSTTKTLTIKGIPELVAGKRYSYKLHVGKDVVTIESVKVNDWENGSSITDKAVFKYVIDGNTITLSSGVLADNPDLIKQTIGSGNSLTVKGTINDDDIAAINEYIKDCDKKIDLDLSGTTITAIPDDAFTKNENLYNVTLPKTLKTIGYNAFYYCHHASFPNFEEVAPSLETIGSDAFCETKLNGSITLSNLKSVGSCAFECTLISSITFPPAITKVPTSLLNGLQTDCSVVFEGKLTDISFYVFRNACITSIDLTACDAVPTCDEDAFYDMPTSIKIIVKSSLLNDFKNAEVWKDIASQLVGK